MTPWLDTVKLITYTSTNPCPGGKVLSKRQHEIHKTHVTGSQIPIIMGESPFKTPLELADERVFPERQESQMEEPRCFRRGHALEEAVAQFGVDEMGWRELISPESEWRWLWSKGCGWSNSGNTIYGEYEGVPIGATPDFLVLDKRGRNVCLEVKTTTSSSGWGPASAPRHYYLQANWQAHVAWALGAFVDPPEEIRFAALVQSRLHAFSVPACMDTFHECLERAREWREAVEEYRDTGKWSFAGDEADADDAEEVVDRDLVLEFLAAKERLKEAKALKSEAEKRVMSLYNCNRVSGGEDDPYLRIIRSPPGTRLNRSQYISELERIVHSDRGEEALERVRELCTEASYRKPHVRVYGKR